MHLLPSRLVQLLSCAAGEAGWLAHSLQSTGRPTPPPHRPPEPTHASTAAARRLVQIFKVTRLTRVFVVLLSVRIKMSDTIPVRKMTIMKELNICEGRRQAGRRGARA